VDHAAAIMGVALIRSRLFQRRAAGRVSLASDHAAGAVCRGRQLGRGDAARVKKVSESLKRSIIIDNRPGSAGNVAAMAIKNAPPDGYTR
jgi:hypothetical protein